MKQIDQKESFQLNEMKMSGPVFYNLACSLLNLLDVQDTYDFKKSFQFASFWYKYNFCKSFETVYIGKNSWSVKCKSIFID